MRLNPGLDAAIEVYRTLGWDQADPHEAPSLPVGTPDQQRIAKAGLRSGDWGEFGQIGERTYGWISAVPVQEALLGVFAVRVGVDAPRAAAVLRITDTVPESVITAALAERGPGFAERFIAAACVPSHRGSEWSPTNHAGSALRLVADLDLPVPDNLDYLKDWSAYAADLLSGRPHYARLSRREPLDESVIRRRFVEHVRAGVALGIGATASFGVVVSQGVRHGWLPRAEAVELAFQGLDVAQRPGDRKAWAAILLDDLEISQAEALGRLDLLIPILATGEAPTTGRFAPLLVAGAPPERLPEVLSAALTTTTAKVRKSVLASLASRDVPGPDAVAELTGLIGDLASARDRSLAVATERLLARWEVTNAAAHPAGPVAAGAQDEPAPDPFAGLWQPTPPVWRVPAFDPGPATPESLTALAAELTGRRDGVVDITVERFLATANAVARRDPADARDALRGVRTTELPGLSWVAPWRDSPGQLADVDTPYRGLLTIREAAAFLSLGQVPILLSEPSTMDLRISPADLVTRLRAYAAAGATAAEADLVLALTRLDTTSATSAELESALAELSTTRVRVLRLDGTALGAHAAAYLRHWLTDPIVEPSLELSGRFWRMPALRTPTALAELSRWFRYQSYESAEAAVFPGWGDAALQSLGYGGGEIQRYLGVLARQAARRAMPLTPGAAVNLLGAQRTPTPDTAADLYDAVQEAWERGLLRPGVADVAYLDWMQPPASLAAFATAMLDLAPTGALAAIWPVLDSLVAESVSARRMRAGTVEVVDAIGAMLPEALAAVADGRADGDVLRLPGVRALAARPGASLAVKTAHELVARLPGAAPVAAAEAAPTPLAESVMAPLDPPFEDVWTQGAGEVPAIPDGVTMSVHWDAGGTRFLAFDLTVPGEPDRLFRVVKGWTYDLTVERQCAATAFRPGELPTGQRDSWLHWDSAAGRLVVSSDRDWATGSPGPLAAKARPARLSDALVAVSLGLTAQSGDDAFTGREAVATLVKEGRFGTDAVASAVRVLLAQPDVMPGRLVRVIDEHLTMLPTLWPILAELLRHAATQKSLPRWLNQVLDVASLRAGYLTEAMRRGILPSDTWEPLREIASRPGTSAALVKARALAQAIAVDDAALR
ncbi:MAG: hypothetical protein KBB39_02840 [Phycicoccus sp.]|nr:hypothetical protein [Phycicoccus sp.]